MDALGTGLGFLTIVIVVLVIVLTILWIILPFTVGKILDEVKKTNNEFFELRLLLEKNTSALRDLKKQSDDI